MTSRPSIAVVIPTFNSGGTLRRCLVSVYAQRPPPDDVVVVDDMRTSDATREIASQFDARLIISPAGMAESRNVGIRSTSTDLVMSVDSDMATELGLTEAILASFSVNGADAATVAEVGDGTTYWARCRALDKMGVEATGLGRSVRVFKRRLFEELNGYDPSLEAGEDLDFHMRATRVGAQIRHIPYPRIVHDEGSLTFLRVVTKKYRYGTTALRFESKHGSWPLLRGYGRRLAAGAAFGLRRDPIAVPGLLVLRTADLLAGALGLTYSRMTPSPDTSRQGLGE